jgi:hypothetical protein
MGDAPPVMDNGNVLRILDELLEGWTAFVGDPNTVLSRWGKRQELQVTAVITLVSHVHATAAHLRPALPDGLTIVHMPLVRSILDATLTAVWCDEVADGANALVNEAARQRANLIETLQQTQTFGKITDELQISDQDRLPSSSNQQARSAKERFDDIALDGAYALYRLLSGMSHISTETIDAYLYPVPADHSVRVKVNPDPMPISAAWTHLIACCLMWSGRVVEYLDSSHARRSDLRRAARELGVKDVLPVRYTAHQRGSRRATAEN